MLEQKYRFHGYGSLRYLFKVGKTVRGRSLSIRYAHNPRRVHSRCAVVITRKVIKAAPKRNRVRRRIYETLRTHWIHILPGYDISINVYDPNFFDMPHEELREVVLEALKQAGLFKKSAKLTS